MPRVVTEQKNVWGTSNGLEAQRKDLWIVDFKDTVNKIAAQLETTLQPVPAYFVRTVSLPELRVKADTFRRDSRSYQMPSWDDPLDAIRMTFVLDARSEVESSHIYRFLDAWRQTVRAGRGALGGEPSIRLNSNYRIDYAFDLTLYLLRGSKTNIVDPEIARAASRVAGATLQSILSSSGAGGGIFGTANLFNGQQLTKIPGETDAEFAARQSTQAQVQRDKAFLEKQSQSEPLSFTEKAAMSQITIDNDLQYAGMYTLENAWLAGFKIGDMDYGDAGTFNTIEAQFYAENVLDLALPKRLAARNESPAI